MLRNNAAGRPATTGYERLAQADTLSDDSDDEVLSRSYASLQPSTAPRHAPVTQPPRPHSGMASPKSSSVRASAAALAMGMGNGSSSSARLRGHRRRRGSAPGIDLKAINARLERWADEITARFKRRRGKGRDGEDDESFEIHHSVFRAPEGTRPLTAGDLADPRPVMAPDEFGRIVESVRVAIDQGVHPSMISRGSSGSYFARNPDGKVVGVFKPKDEEPYAAGNPKWNKWIHRNLFPCCFGRACLIPNLSYVSEAAAYTLDCQLRTHIVPPTDVVCLSSKSFHYPFWDRYSFHRKNKPLPSKPGSFQVFLRGFEDASEFLHKHPWPGQHPQQNYWPAASRNADRRRSRCCVGVDNCRPSVIAAGEDVYSDHDEDGDGGDGDGNGSGGGGERPDTASAGLDASGSRRFVWTETLKRSFREELEKLVVLDYIMRNTDRGSDNWMIKVDWETQRVSVVSEPVRLNMNTAQEDDDADAAPRPVNVGGTASPRPPATQNPYRSQRPMQASTPPRDPAISIGAIDNSLSWPWKHPDAWRSFPFGWLFLPVDLVGRPFSQKTRDHFLPLLTSTAWWSQTQLALRKVFMKDPDFQERMFARQIAVMKGQAWNVVETLKMEDHGPLELTRRAKVCVWDDLVEIPVAVPMRMTPDVRVHDPPAAAAAAARSIDEVDIGASVTTASRARSGVAAVGEDVATPSAEMPHPGRFERNSPQPPLRGTVFSYPSAPSYPPAPSPNYLGTPPDEDSASVAEDVDTLGTSAPVVHSGHAPPPHHAAAPRHQTRRSLSGQPGSANRTVGFAQPTPSRTAPTHRQPPPLPRGGSFATSLRAGRTIAQQLHGSAAVEEGHDEWLDDDDFYGDLGYAAAEDMEGNHRKVIVERLEPVKTRNPVFTCW